MWGLIIAAGLVLAVLAVVAACILLNVAKKRERNKDVYKEHIEKGGSDAVQMTFDEFMQYFSVAPEKWFAHESNWVWDFVQIVQNNRKFDTNRIGITYRKNRESSFSIVMKTIEDYEKFLEFLKKTTDENFEAERKEKLEKNERKRTENHIAFLNEIQRDIERLRMRSEKEIQRAKNTVEEVAERIRQG